MTESRPNSASPAIAALTIAGLVWLMLSLAGEDLVKNAHLVSERTSVTILAVLKEGRWWVSLGLGVLVFAAVRQVQNRQPALNDNEFLRWSAALPQWRPQHPSGETAVFFVPPSASNPRAVSTPPEARAPETPAATEAPAPAPAKPLPVIRLAPLQEMAGRFAIARAAGVASAAPPVMALQPVSSGGGALAKPGRVEIPASLDLPALAALPRSEFEKIAGELFRRQGYDVAALGGGEDAGVDLIMTGKSEVLIAKCWLRSEPVPVESVRELLALTMQEGATRGILITSGDFARKAIKFANSRGKHRLQLISGRQFQNLMAASAAGAAPACPCCGGRTLMAERKGKFGRSQRFWQCSRAPGCPGVIRADRRAKTPAPRPLLPAA